MKREPKPQELMPLPPLLPSDEGDRPDDAKLEFRRMYGRWDRPAYWQEDEV